MPKVHVKGAGSFEVKSGRRLVNVIEENGVDIGHRCGGQARCTTCRIRFHEGEPDVMTVAEYKKLTERDLYGQARLSCQIVVDHDMMVEPLIRVSEMGWHEPGPQPTEHVEPASEWFPIDELREHDTL